MRIVDDRQRAFPRIVGHVGFERRLPHEIENAERRAGIVRVGPPGGRAGVERDGPLRRAGHQLHHRGDADDERNREQSDADGCSPGLFGHVHPVNAKAFTAEAHRTQRSESEFLCGVRASAVRFNGLNQRVFPRHGNRRNRDLHVHRHFIGPEVELGILRLLPRDFLAGVRAHAAHDGGERALGDALGFVERLAGADAS